MSIVEKLYSQPDKTELIGYYWSRKHHKPIKGINLITLYYTDINEVSIPVNYRIYRKKEGKTQNDYLREMILEVINWGICPGTITTDTWVEGAEELPSFTYKSCCPPITLLLRLSALSRYSSKENLNFFI